MQQVSDLAAVALTGWDLEVVHFMNFAAFADAVRNGGEIEYGRRRQDMA
jgi:hypothetical protein